MHYKTFLAPVMIFTITSQLVAAQERPDTLADPNRIKVQDVFDNMHYDQQYRPQVHYTPITGEIGDATGLIYYKGTYHLFYMYDEWSKRRKFNKNWGHAISHDVIFWEQQPQVLNTVLDNRPGSGSGIVDWNNTLGLQSGVEKTLVLFYTDYGRGTSMVFSRDGGKTWVRHKDNPVIPMPPGRADRDAFVFWYKPDQSWRMVLYETPAFSFYKSTDLLNWKYQSKIEGFHECPDFIEMPVDGDPSHTQWVIINGDGTYRIGDYNGSEFSSMMGNTKVDHGYIYATQTFKHSYEGDGPFIQMAFMAPRNIAEQTLTWSKQQSFPCELTLKTIGRNIQLCRNPIDGIKQLRHDSQFWNNLTLNPGKDSLICYPGDVFEIYSEIDLEKSAGFEFTIRGERLIFSTKEQLMNFMGSSAKVIPENNKVHLRFIVDRSSVEIFINKGEVTFSDIFYPDPSNLEIKLTSTGGKIKLDRMEAYKLSSIWLKREQDLGYYRSSEMNQ